MHADSTILRVQVVGGETTVDRDTWSLIPPLRWRVVRRRAKSYVAADRRRPETGVCYLHRLIVTAKRGDVVQHINGDGLDNRRCNLRVASLGFTVDPVTGCWNWTGCLNANGYAVRAVKDGSRLVHRRHYEEKYGRVPRGMHLDHVCRNHRCVNPDHLEVVTPAENSRRGVMAHLTAHRAMALRFEVCQKVTGGMSVRAACDEASARYGISIHTADSVVRGRTWKDVGGPLVGRDYYGVWHREPDGSIRCRGTAR